MAIFHCQIKNINAGKSIFAAAAYRSGEKLYDFERQKYFKYSKPEVIFSQVFLCENAPDEYQNRQRLWESVRAVEGKQNNARLAREFEVAIPKEFENDKEKAIELIRSFSKKLSSQGMIIDASIHWKKGNPHAHLLATTRRINKNGTWSKIKEKKVYKLDKQGNKIPIIDPETGKQKIRIRPGKGAEKLWERETIVENDFNKRSKVKEWRSLWKDEVNSSLKEAGFDIEITDKGYKELGINQLPTIHEGFVARDMENDGKVSRLRAENRRRKALNFLKEETNPIFSELDEVFAERALNGELDEVFAKFTNSRKQKNVEQVVKPVVEEAVPEVEQVAEPVVEEAAPVTEKPLIEEEKVIEKTPPEIEHLGEYYKWLDENFENLPTEEIKFHLREIYPTEEKLGFPFKEAFDYFYSKLQDRIESENEDEHQR